MQEHPFYLTWMNNHAIIHISATHIFTVFFVVFFYDGNRCRHVSDMFLLHIANKRGASMEAVSLFSSRIHLKSLSQMSTNFPHQSPSVNPRVLSNSGNLWGVWGAIQLHSLVPTGSHLTTSWLGIVVCRLQLGSVRLPLRNRFIRIQLLRHAIFDLVSPHTQSLPGI